MLNKIKGKPVVILLAEDNKADQVFVQSAFNLTEIRNNLFFVNDGVEAMEYMHREGKFNDPKYSPKPDLILLDVNMPRMNGKEVLKELKTDPDLKSVPVIMLTTSDHENDVIESYNFGVNAYITKPAGLDRFIDTIESLKNFWLQVVALPTTTN
ncbi:MAG: response regulator [Planctomycetota bacterium]|jgi:CheY-like chemotaxis protein